MTETEEIEVATAHYTKGRKLWTKGDRDNALALFRKALSIQEAVLGIYDRQTARTYYWVGFALSHRKEYDKALVAYRRTLRIRLFLLGDEDVSTEDVKRALRDVLKKKGFNKDKIQAYLDGITTSVRHEKLGGRYERKGRHNEALEEYEKCLEVEKKAMGAFPLDFGRIYAKIGSVYKMQGEDDMSLSAYRDALAMFVSKLGQKHSDSIDCIDGIETAAFSKGVEESKIEKYLKEVFNSISHVVKGDKLISDGNFQGALGEYEKALSIEEDALGKHPLTAAEIHRRIAACYISKKRVNHAIMSLRTALAIFIFDLGSDHKSAMSCLRELGRTMREGGVDSASVNKYLNTVSYSVKYERYAEHIHGEGDFAGAISEFQKAMSLEVAALGKQHLTQAALFKGIGIAFNSQGKYDQAILNCRNALQIYQLELGRDHPETSSTVEEMLSAAKKQGLSAEELEIYSEATRNAIEEEMKGDNMLKAGQRQNAIEAYRRAITLEEKSLGQSHLCTSNLYSKVADTLKDLRDFDKALVKYRDLLVVYQKPLGLNHPNSESAIAEITNIVNLNRLKYKGKLHYSRQEITESVIFEKRGDELLSQELFDDAVTSYRKALKVEQTAFGENFLTAAGLFSKIADVYRLKGQHNRALLVYRKAIQIFRTFNIPESDDMGRTMANLGLAVQGLGFNDSMATKYQKAVKQSLQNEGSGDNSFHLGNYDAAIAAYRLAIEAEESILGMLPATTSTLYKKIAEICAEEEDYESALLFYSKVLAIEESHLGKSSEETLKTFNNLLSVSQLYAADNGRNLNGWTTLQYVLAGLIGALVLIATVVKSWSKNKRPIKALEVSAYQRSALARDRIRKERNNGGRGQNRKLEPPEENYTGNGSWGIGESDSESEDFSERYSADGDDYHDGDEIQEELDTFVEPLTGGGGASIEDAEGTERGGASIEDAEGTEVEEISYVSGDAFSVEEFSVDTEEFEVEEPNGAPIPVGNKTDTSSDYQDPLFQVRLPPVQSAEVANRLEVFNSPIGRPSSIADRIKALQKKNDVNSKL